VPPAPEHCILCPNPPPLTGEHIWPEWYSRLHPERRYELETIFGEDPATYTEKDSLDLKPEVLCHRCNTRWGSTFENKTKPDIWPMSEGAAHTISLESAQRLARWTCFKAMVAEYLADEERRESAFFVQSEREHLRRYAGPPPSVAHVWIGRYVGERHDAGWIMDRRSVVPFQDDPPVAADLYVQTLAIGQLAFQILCCHFLTPRAVTEQGGILRIEGYFLRAPGEWEDALIRIWPLPDRPVEWPPPLAFDDEGFRNLARRWHQAQPAGGVEDDPPADTP
jgi:hypothetical protein